MAGLGRSFILPASDNMGQSSGSDFYQRALRFLWLSMSVGRFYDLASAWDTLVAVASEVFPAFIHRVWRLREGFRQIEIDEHNRVMTLNFD